MTNLGFLLGGPSGGVGGAAASSTNAALGPSATGRSATGLGLGTATGAAGSGARGLASAAGSLGRAPLLSAF